MVSRPNLFWTATSTASVLAPHAAPLPPRLRSLPVDDVQHPAGILDILFGPGFRLFVVAAGLEGFDRDRVGRAPSDDGLDLFQVTVSRVPGAGAGLEQPLDTSALSRSLPNPVAPEDPLMVLEAILELAMAACPRNFLFARSTSLRPQLAGNLNSCRCCHFAYVQGTLGGMRSFDDVLCLRHFCGRPMDNQ